MLRRRKRTHRRWRAENPQYDHERRLSAKLLAAEGGAELRVVAKPSCLVRIGWEVVQSEMGTKPTVILQDLVRLALEGAQTEIRIQALKTKEKLGRLAVRRPQTETAAAVPDG